MCAARWICAKWDTLNYHWTKTYEECRSVLNSAKVHETSAADMLSGLHIILLNIQVKIVFLPETW